MKAGLIGMTAMGALIAAPSILQADHGQVPNFYSITGKLTVPRFRLNSNANEEFSNVSFNVVGFSDVSLSFALIFDKDHLFNSTYSSFIIGKEKNIISAYRGPDSLSMVP